MPDRYTKNYPVTIVNKVGTVFSSNRNVAKEDTIEVSVNGNRVASILASPTCVKELAVGYAICEGIVNPDEILDVRVDNMNVNLTIKKTDDFIILSEFHSGCNGARHKKNEDITVSSDAVFPKSSIFSGTKFLESDVYCMTKGTHLAAFVSIKGKLAAQAIDIGRHNSIDKVVGYAFFNKIDVSQLYLLSTGRQSAGMVLKAARAGVPLIVTKSAPLDSGINAAQRTGVGLVGLVSNIEMTVFANQWRID